MVEIFYVIIEEIHITVIMEDLADWNVDLTYVRIVNKENSYILIFKSKVKVKKK